MLSKSFEVLSDLVDKSSLGNIDSVKGVKHNREYNQLIGVEKLSHITQHSERKNHYVGENENSEQKYTKDKANQRTLDYNSSVDIVQAIKQGKAPACVRQVDVNKLHEKCFDLQQCIKQQKNTYGFFPVFNPKQMRLAYNANQKLC